MNYKFNSRDEYTKWCVQMVQDIGLASIVVDNETVQNTVAHIQSTLHCSEGWELWNDDEDKLTYDQFIERHQDW